MTREAIAMRYEGVLFCDGLDEALIGISHRAGSEPVACYDIAKCLQIFRDQGMTLEEAAEFFETNVLGAYVGAKTPCFVEVVAEGDNGYVGPY